MTPTLSEAIEVKRRVQMPRNPPEEGHLWNVKKICRVCGIKREDFIAKGKPQCPGYTKSAKASKAKPLASR